MPMVRTSMAARMTAATAAEAANVWRAVSPVRSENRKNRMQNRYCTHMNSGSE